MKREDLKRIVNTAFSQLPDREENVIRKLYNKNKTLDNAGKCLGIIIERTRKIKEKGLRNLRKDRKLFRKAEGYISYLPFIYF